MSRKRLRRIVVDGETYTWQVTPWTPNWVILRVWQRRTPLAEVRIRFDDPWVHYPLMLILANRDPDALDERFAREPLTSRHVAGLIRTGAGRDGRLAEFQIVDGVPRALPTPPD